MSKYLKRASYEVVPDGEALFFSYHDHKNAIVRNRAEKYLSAYNIVCRLCYQPVGAGIYFWHFFVIDGSAYCMGYYTLDPGPPEETWEDAEQTDCNFSYDGNGVDSWWLLQNYSQNIVFLDLIYGDMTTLQMAKDGTSQYFADEYGFLKLYMPVDWVIDSNYYAKQQFEETIDYDYEVVDPYIVKKAIAYLNVPEITEVTLQSSPSMARIYTSSESDDAGFLTNLTRIGKRPTELKVQEEDPDDPYGLQRWLNWTYQPYFYLAYFGDLAFFTPRLHLISELTVDFEPWVIFEPIDIQFKYTRGSRAPKNASKIIKYARKYDLVAFQQQAQFLENQNVKPGPEVEAAILDAFAEELQYGTKREEITYGRARDNSFMVEYLSSAEQIKDIYHELRDYLYRTRKTMTMVYGAVAVSMSLLRTLGKIKFPFYGVDTGNLSMFG